MAEVGICVKCGQLRLVRDHHSKGYLPPYEDYTEKYCFSCDVHAHSKARKAGKCNLNKNERTKMSNDSCSRRHKDIAFFPFYDTPLKNVRLYEHIRLKYDGSIQVDSDFVCAKHVQYCTH